jgi:predicted transcriptional regulator
MRKSGKTHSKFKQYLDEQQLTVCEFALISKIPKSTLYRIYNQELPPSRKTAFKIINASKGKLTLEDLRFD